MIRAPLTVCAKNEAATLGDCLDSILAAVAVAEARLPVRLDVQVVLDDCSDGSELVARAWPVRVLRSSGGKVEAQRAGVRVYGDAPFRLFADADILVAPDALAEIIARLLADDALQVVCAAKRPVPPERTTPLAQAIHVYNARGGFARARGWFAGQLFAIRGWQVPTPAELAPRAARRRGDRFYQLERGLTVDDVYLSRALAARPGALAVAGTIWFRAPETWRGMYRYYRRLRRELERVELLFPELPRIAPRRTDAAQLAAAPALERRLFRWFQAALALCRVAYRVDRAYHQWLARTPSHEWTPIAETKRPLPVAVVRPG